MCGKIAKYAAMNVAKAIIIVGVVDAGHVSQLNAAF